MMWVELSQGVVCGEHACYTVRCSAFMYLPIVSHPPPHRLDDLRTEYDDFQESSRELEAELEAQLEQAEGVNKDLLSRVQRLENENESMRVSLCV